ncbi:BMP family protein [Roseicitreum antarcticum]|uniref:Nucleoside-binding protein n=1 Tax=Roseicitreum antarcticum TaxID=564137 RepID=A0A1H2TMM7_9RHOB|nr:BMP family protein [Roseicitreum antarcticum]SDW44514.1 nucleoside-binding protein [Roseicitreum antarcticum]
MRIAVFFVGEVEDRGFNASALAGVEAAQAQGGRTLTVVRGIPYDQAAIREALRQITSDVDGVVFVGGQGNMAMPEIAAAHPDQQFAIVQGAHTAANLASYDVRQEDSAFLAGVLAARITRTGTVAHLSGHRVKPGLKGRAAFVGGVHHVAPDMPVLTAFCGTQDDSGITRQWASAQAGSGADVLFTMLNAARDGAVDACRETGMRQIGNALNWVDMIPDVFCASALAQIDRAVVRAVDNMAAGIVPEQIVEMGLADGDDCVGLALHPQLADAHGDAIAAAAAEIAVGRLGVPVDYQGPEFTLEHGERHWTAHA